MSSEGVESESTGAGPLRLLAALGPDYTLFFIFFITLLGLGMTYGAHWVWQEGTIYLCFGAALVMILVRFLANARDIVAGRGRARREFVVAAGRIVRDWGPLLLLAIVFENLASYTGIIRKVSIDDALYRMDVALFGVEPTVWLSKLDIPILTDWMAFAYATYIVTPLILAVFLLARGRREDFRELSTAVIVQMCLGFVLFLVFPAGPPRFYEPLLHPAAGAVGFEPAHLHSFFGLYEFQQSSFDVVDPLPSRSAFPSVHCSLAMVTIVYGWRFSNAVVPRWPRFWRWVSMLLGVSLWVSTVYLRHHWVVDCAAGIALGAFSCWAAPVLRRAWPTAERLRPAVAAEQAPVGG
jgi:membrane-associated phospholipid phosphatase